MFTAASVMDSAASALNDTAKTLYSYVVLLPYLKMAYKELESELVLNEVPLQLEVSAVIDVAAGATTLVTPADFFLPISLKERRDGSTNDDDFVDMVEMSFEPLTQQSTNLEVWSFREGTINFVGATEAREVKLRYWKSLAAIVDETTQLALEPFQQGLSYRTAALAARLIGRNDGRADYLDGFAGTELDKGLSIFIKANQAKRVRRKRFSARVYSR